MLHRITHALKVAETLTGALLYLAGDVIVHRHHTV